MRYMGEGVLVVCGCYITLVSLRWYLQCFLTCAFTAILLGHVLHCEPKKHTEMFLSYLPQNLVNSGKIWCILSCVNWPYSDVSVFHLTGIMSLRYLVRLSFRVL